MPAPRRRRDHSRVCDKWLCGHTVFRAQAAPRHLMPDREDQPHKLHLAARLVKDFLKANHICVQG